MFKTAKNAISEKKNLIYLISRFFAWTFFKLSGPLCPADEIFVKT